VQIARLRCGKIDTFEAETAEPDNCVGFSTSVSASLSAGLHPAIAFSNNLGGSILTFDANVGIGILPTRQIAVF
jgi:hypothetical protein